MDLQSSLDKIKTLESNNNLFVKPIEIMARKEQLTDKKNYQQEETKLSEIALISNH